MKTTLAAIAALALSAGAATLAFLTWSQVRTLREELEAAQVLRASPGDAGLPDSGAAETLPPAPLPDRVATLERELARLSESAATAPVPLPALTESEPADVPSSSAGAPLPVPGAPATAGGPPRAASRDPKIDALVRKAIDAEFAARQRRQNKWPTLQIFADALQLDAAQRKSIHAKLLDTDRRFLEVFRAPSSNGWSAFDAFTQAYAAPPEKAGAVWAETMQRFKTEIVPGTDQTYEAWTWARHGEVYETYKKTLNAEQFKEFEAWQLPASQVVTPDSPYWKAFWPRVNELRAEHTARAGK